MAAVPGREEEASELQDVDSDGGGKAVTGEDAGKNLCSAEDVTRRTVIIEPVMVVYLSLISIMVPLTSQYSIAIFNERYNVSLTNATQCGMESINSSLHLRRQAAQAAAANYQTVLDVTQGVPSLFVAFFLGTFTDRVGRKVGLILSSIGAILRAAIFLLPQLTALPLEVTYAGSLLDGIFGSDTIMVGTCYAYLADVTTVDRRSFRIMMAELVQNGIKGLMHLGIGYAIATLGFLVPYLTILVLHALNMAYVVFLVPETRGWVPGGKVIAKEFILEPFRTAFGRSAEHNKRKLLLLGLGGFTFLCFGQQGQFGIENLFLINSPLCFGPVLLSYWKFVRIVIQCIAYVIFMKFLLVPRSDALVVVISAASAVGYFIIFPFSTQTWIAFTALAVAFASKQNIPVAKVMLSKLVSSEKQGAIMSVTNVIDKLCALLGNAIFNTVYGATLLTFRGTVYVCFAILTAVGTALMLIFHFKFRRFSAKEDDDVRDTSTAH